ncbi:MAG: hypothetical protein JWP27_2644 [Flaviaesturariibacter sp.]|nr:hypothetical protein [Flaviaesturariibacter sp.]
MYVVQRPLKSTIDRFDFPDPNCPTMQTIQRIFLVEDDIDDRELFTKALAEISDTIELTCVGECVDMLPLLEELVPDLVFLDLQLPKRHGRDCLADIQAHPVLQAIPLVIITSLHAPQDITACLTGGAKLFFQKPANYRELVRHLRTILRLSWDHPGSVPPMYLQDGVFRPFHDPA